MTFKAGSWGDSDDSSEGFAFSGPTPDNPEVTESAEKLSSTFKRSSLTSPNEDPPKVNYDKLYSELGKYNFLIEKEANISDIREYLTTIQKFRSRLIALEQEAERHHSSIDMTFEYLSSYELLQRPEKTAKEKEAGVLLKLVKWAEAVEEAKIYAGACKKFREQLDTTHHIISKILTTYDLEVRLRGYQDKPRGPGGDPIEGSW